MNCCLGGLDISSSGLPGESVVYLYCAYWRECSSLLPSRSYSEFNEDSELARETHGTGGNSGDGGIL